MKTKTLDRWKPVRRGNIYCSPGCGRGCTHREYLTMKNQAVLMCKTLSDGWEPVITENLGWFARAVKGNTTIHYQDDRSGSNHPPIIPHGLR